MVYIKIVCDALGLPSPENDSYIKEFYPDTDELGLGELVTTRDLGEAKQFASTEEAMEFWQQQSKRVPLRPDGRPNKPLTAYTVEIARFDAAS